MKKLYIKLLMTLIALVYLQSCTFHTIPYPKEASCSLTSLFFNAAEKGKKFYVNNNPMYRNKYMQYGIGLGNYSKAKNDFNKCSNGRASSNTQHYLMYITAYCAFDSRYEFTLDKKGTKVYKKEPWESKYDIAPKGMSQPSCSNFGFKSTEQARLHFEKFDIEGLKNKSTDLFFLPYAKNDIEMPDNILLASANRLPGGKSSYCRHCNYYKIDQVQRGDNTAKFLTAIVDFINKKKNKDNIPHHLKYNDETLSLFRRYVDHDKLTTLMLTRYKGGRLHKIKDKKLLALINETAKNKMGSKSHKGFEKEQGAYCSSDQFSDVYGKLSKYITNAGDLCESKISRYNTYINNYPMRQHPFEDDELGDRKESLISCANNKKYGFSNIKDKFVEISQKNDYYKCSKSDRVYNGFDDAEKAYKYAEEVYKYLEKADDGANASYKSLEKYYKGFLRQRRAEWERQSRAQGRRNVMQYQQDIQRNQADLNRIQRGYSSAIQQFQSSRREIESRKNNSRANRTSVGSSSYRAKTPSKPHGLTQKQINARADKVIAQRTPSRKKEKSTSSPKSRMNSSLKSEKSNSCWSGYQDGKACMAEDGNTRKNGRFKVKYRNTCGARVFVKICIKKDNDKWSCGANGVRAGKSYSWETKTSRGEHVVKSVGVHKPSEDFLCASKSGGWKGP